MSIPSQYIVKSAMKRTFTNELSQNTLILGSDPISRKIQFEYFCVEGQFFGIQQIVLATLEPPVITNLKHVKDLSLAKYYAPLPVLIQNGYQYRGRQIHEHLWENIGLIVPVEILDRFEQIENIV